MPGLTEPQEDGTLPIRLAQRQVGERLLRAHGETRDPSDRTPPLRPGALAHAILVRIAIRLDVWASRPQNHS